MSISASRLMLTCVCTFQLASVAGFMLSPVGSRASAMLSNVGSRTNPMLTICTVKRQKRVAQLTAILPGSRLLPANVRVQNRLRVSASPGDQVAGTVTVTSDGLKTKQNMNTYRKVFHALSGVGLALAYELLLTRLQATVLFGLSFVVLTAIEVLRLRYPLNEVSKFLFGQFRKIARDYETNQVTKDPTFHMALSPNACNS